MRKARRYTLGEIFVMPLLLAVVTIVGLVAALLGDGWLDALSWTGLAIPALVIPWAFLLRRM